LASNRIEGGAKGREKRRVYAVSTRQLVCKSKKMAVKAMPAVSEERQLLAAHESALAGPRADPPTLDWSRVELPPTWVDRLQAPSPRDFWILLKRLFGKRRPAELPLQVPGIEMVPAYALQDFHHLPNGFYSRRFAEHYTRWFDVAMLGHMASARTEIVSRLRGCKSVLDLGCGGGDLGAALTAAGVPDVLGLDVSPYMLRQASLRHPGIRLVHRAAEDTGFREGRFDAVAVCFLFHELPSAAQDAVLVEIRRILAGSGRLVICEPAPQQMREGWWRLLRQYGPMGWFWKLLARVVHEPYVKEWHARDVPAWLTQNGFRVVQEWVKLPFRTVIAELR
jgi:ubiquinone/menaquinone biosynthesis C-methylase UbiE